MELVSEVPENHGNPKVFIASIEDLISYKSYLTITTPMAT